MIRTAESLATLREQLEHGTDDARYAAWLALYRGATPDYRAEWERIVRGGDPILQVLCARFLADRPDGRAVAVLVRFVSDVNPVLHAAARRAFERNRCDAKYDYLLPLLAHAPAAARSFVVAQLAASGNALYVDPLLTCCATADAPFLVELLMALRCFPESRVVRAMRGYVHHPQLAIRHAAVLALGVLHGLHAPGAHRALWHAAGDTEPRIRRFVVWGVRQQLRRWDLWRLRRWLLRERAPEVIEELFRAIAHFPTAANLAQILQTAATADERALRLRGEAIVLAAPPWAVAWAVALLRRHADARVRHQALRLGAITQRAHPHFFSVLAQHLADAAFPADEMTVIAALGDLGDPRAIPLLEARVMPGVASSSSAHRVVLSYAALTALLKVLRNRPPEALLPYVSHAALSPLHQQMVLRALLHHAATRPLSDDMLTTVRRFLSHENLNLRYLAGEILARARDRASLPALLAMMTAEADPGLRAYLGRGLQHWLPHDPAAIAECRDLAVGTAGHSSVVVLEMLFAALASSEGAPATILAQVPALCGPRATGDAPLYREYAAAYLCTQLAQHRISLADLFAELATHPDRGAWLQTLANVATARELRLSVPIDVFQRRWSEAPPAERELLIEWLALAQEREAIVPLAHQLAQADATAQRPLVAALHRALHAGDPSSARSEA